MMEMIRQMRVEADEFMLYLENEGGSDEMNNCLTSMKLGRAWLGKLLGELGEPTPYANDGARENIEDIEPAADKAEGDAFDFHGKYISVIDQMREAIKSRFLHPLEHNAPSKSGKQIQFGINAHTHFSEARFWLGYELERIKNEAERLS